MTETIKPHESMERRIAEQEKKETEAVFKFEANFFIQHATGDSITGDYEETIKELQKKELIAIGDLHGSALKLLETLVMGGFATLPAEAAKKFKEIYTEVAEFRNQDQKKYQGDFKEDYAKFFEEKHLELQELITQIKWTGGERTFVLLGDVIFDRGLSDILTLSILDRLYKTGGNDQVVILASNHDMTYFDDESITDNNKKRSYIDAAAFAFNNNLTDKLAILQTEHLKRLKLFYLDPVSKTLCSHGLISPEHIKYLISFANIDHLDKESIDFSSIQDIQEVEAIVILLNDWFSKAVEMSIDDNDLYTRNFQKFIKPIIWAQGTMVQGPGTDAVYYEQYLTPEEIPFFGIIKFLLHGHRSWNFASGDSPYLSKGIRAADDIDEEINLSKPDPETMIVPLDSRYRHAEEHPNNTTLVPFFTR